MTLPNQARTQASREEPHSHTENGQDDSLAAMSRIGLGLAALGGPVYLTTGRSDALGAPKTEVSRQCVPARLRSWIPA